MEFEISRMQKFKSYLKECARIIRITKKPTGTEFKTIVKVSGLGIIVIGLLGFFITMMKQVFF